MTGGARAAFSGTATQWPLWAFAWCLLALCGACSDDGTASPSVGPLVIPRANAPAEPESRAESRPEESLTPAEIEEGLHQVQGALDRGDYERALALGDGLIQRGISGTERDQVEAARMAAKQHLLQTFYLDVIVHVDKPMVTVGEPITGEVVLVNLSPQPLHIADTAVGGTGRAASNSRTLVRFETTFTEHGYDGTVIKDKLTQNVLFGEPVTILPGGRHAIPLRIDTLEHDPGGVSLKEYDIRGTLYLAELRAGDDPVPGNVALRGVRVRVMPRNWEHLAQSPLSRLAEAIQRRSPPHVPLVAALIPDGNRREAYAILKKALEDQGATGPDRSMRTAICVALRVMTGEDRKPEPSEWMDRLVELLRRS